MDNNLCIIGDGSVKDQWGAMVLTFTTKSSFQEICQISHPVDGNPNNMKELRAEATFVLSAISILQVLQPLLQNKQININIHTSCRGLINRVVSKNINRPSNVLADHIDIIYQIRHILKNLKNIKVTFIYTIAPKEDDLDKAPKSEQLLYKMHKIALTYYHNKNCSIPNHQPILFPAQKLCVTYNNKPIVTDIASFLQDSERKQIREDYMSGRMNIHPSTIEHIDQYSLGRVFKKSKGKSAMYAKIIHKQLNTMTVNNK